MVQRDYIARRLGEGGSGISYAEFSYTILQGMDFLHLFDTYGCTLQLGGSDQWGNCISGVDLIRRARSADAHVITLPLIINKATGKKFGKSEEGAVWLDPAKTTPYKFYQFWLNADDDGVEGYLKIFTELDKPTVDTVMSEFRANPGGRSAQKTLAYEITKIVHGAEKTEAVRKVTEVLFGERPFQELGADELKILQDELPVVHATADDQLGDILVRAALAPSRSEANRLIKGGAVAINGTRITPDMHVAWARGANLLRRGKNSFAIVSV